MSEDNQVEAQILRIQDKLQQLLRQRDLLLKENGKLREELRKIQEGQAGEGKRLEQLRQQVEVLRVTKTVMSEGEKRELEKRLGQYIREIDRCIALLGE
jgi:septal ring factor EnvC (AmiA/AmiB activator)